MSLNFFSIDDSPYEEDAFDIPDTPPVNITPYYISLFSVARGSKLIYADRIFAGGLPASLFTQPYSPRNSHSCDRIRQYSSRSLRQKNAEGIVFSFNNDNNALNRTHQPITYNHGGPKSLTQQIDTIL